MNKRIIKYFWALPLLGMLSGCSDSSVNEGSQNSNYAVNFSVAASKQSNSDGTKSRATIVDNDVVNAANSSFGLYAYSHTGDWSTVPNNTPDFMNDQKVEYSGGSWTYNPLKFWSTDNVSFFGYWPYKDCTLLPAGASIKTSVAASAMPQIEFTQDMDPEKMVDFITTYATNKNSGSGVVSLNFNHVLTRLNFKARLDDALTNANTTTSTTHVFVTGLKICGTNGSTGANGAAKANSLSRVYKTATFVLGDGTQTTAQGGGKLEDADGQWKYDAAPAASPVINAAVPQDEAVDVKSIMPIDNITITSDGSDPANPTGTTKTFSDVVELLQNGGVTDLLTATPKQHYLFLIPPHGAEGIKAETDVIIEFTYKIVTGDESVDSKFYEGKEQTVAVSLPDGTLKQGKAYNIIFTVGLNKVDFDVNVADWDTDEVYASSHETATPDEDGIVAAWRRLDKTKAQDETGNYFVINVNNTPGSQLNLREKIDDGNNNSGLDDFKLGDQVELLFSNPADGSKLPYDKGALLPNGWIYDVRTVNNTERYIMVKVADYITKVAKVTASDIKNALTALKDVHDPNIHYYAVNVYGPALTSDDLNLSTFNADDVFSVSGGFDLTKDYIYIIFNSDDGTKTYAAPAGWEIEKVTSEKTLGKYRLQKKTASQTSNIAIGNTGFVAGSSTIDVNQYRR